MAGSDVIINLFAEHNPCMPLSQFENKTARFTAVTIGKKNIIHAIDIAKLRKLHSKSPFVHEALAFIGDRAYDREFIIKDLSQCKPFHKQFKNAFSEFPCLANMQPDDIVDFFGIDPKTILREIAIIAKQPQGICSFSDIIAKKIEEIHRKNNQTLARN